MNANHPDSLRRLHAENVLLFSLSQALIATHPHPEALRDMFERLHNEVMAGPLFDECTDQGLLDAIADEHKHMLGRIEHVIGARRSASAQVQQRHP